MNVKTSRRHRLAEDSIYFLGIYISQQDLHFAESVEKAHGSPIPFQEQTMKKIDSFGYDVRPNEPIVIEVTPENFNDSMFSVRANLDGEKLEATGSENAPRYEFTISKPVNDIHTIIFEFTFIQGSPENALYQVAISGQDDEGCPCGFTVRKTTGVKEPAVEFFVVA